MDGGCAIEPQQRPSLPVDIIGDKLGPLAELSLHLSWSSLAHTDNRIINKPTSSAQLISLLTQLTVHRTAA